MQHKKILFGAIAIGAGMAATRLLFSKLSAEKPAPASSPYADIDAYVTEQMHKLNIPAVSLAIVKGKRVVHYRGFGAATPGGKAPTPETLFFIGSVTKSFTALAIMQLVRKRKVQLDAPVQRYLPWFRVADPEASAQITVRHLLNHTSGLSMLQGQMVLADLDDSPGAAERQARELSTQKLSYPVGTTFAYNNTNYNLLGSIIEAASGETYAEYVQNHIFNPLGMNRSFTSKPAAQKKVLATGHRYWFGYPVPAPDLPIPERSLASGQLISCAKDMAHYLIAQLNGGVYGQEQILSAAGIEKMHHGTVEMLVMGKPIGTYGMGWESNVVGKSTIISHGGIVPDYGAFAALIPGQEKAIILLYNANHAFFKLTFDEFGMGAAERLAGEQPSKMMFGAAPWVMRAMALIPVVQGMGVLATLGQLRRWRRHPESQPSPGRMWCRHILLPLVPNLLVASSLIPILSKMRSWIQLFMPDFACIARACGSFAALWALVRTRLMLQALWRNRT